MELEESIKSTLAFFAVKHQPLTPMEVWRFLWSPQATTRSNCQLTDVKEKLEEMASRGEIGVVHQFYFLPKTPDGQKVDGEKWYIERQWLGILALQKWRRAVWGTKLLRLIPFVRLVAVGNTLAMEQAREDSDIDLLIVARAGRLWLVRFWSVLILQIFGLRRHGQKTKNRLCLSFYITDDVLDLSGLAKQPVDPYLVYWLAILWPIWGMETYQKFWNANKWIQNYLPLAFPRQPNTGRRVLPNLWVEWIPKCKEWALSGKIGDQVEKFYRWLMWRHIQGHKESRLWQKDSDVVVSNQMLKFHEIDRRVQIREEWGRWIASNKSGGAGSGFAG